MYSRQWTFNTVSAAPPSRISALSAYAFEHMVRYGLPGNPRFAATRVNRARFFFIRRGVFQRYIDFAGKFRTFFFCKPDFGRFDTNVVDNVSKNDSVL